MKKVKYAPINIWFLSQWVSCTHYGKKVKPLSTQRGYWYHISFRNTYDTSNSTLHLRQKIVFEHTTMTFHKPKTYIFISFQLFFFPESGLNYQHSIVSLCPRFRYSLYAQIWWAKEVKYIYLNAENFELN